MGPKELLLSSEGADMFPQQNCLSGPWWVVPVTVRTGTRLTRSRTCQERSQAERRESAKQAQDTELTTQLDARSLSGSGRSLHESWVEGLGQHGDSLPPWALQRTSLPVRWTHFPHKPASDRTPLCFHLLVDSGFLAACVSLSVLLVSFSFLQN